jgi:hypothetical protein
METGMSVHALLLVEQLTQVRRHSPRFRLAIPYFSIRLRHRACTAMAVARPFQFY